MAVKKPYDPNGRHVRVYVSLLNCAAWRVLGPSAIKLFMDLRASLTGSNNGNLSATLSDLRHRGWNSSATLAKALAELRVLGFLKVTREGGLKMGTRICTLYRFTDLEVFEQPRTGVLPCRATHDYTGFQTVKDAEFELAAAQGRRRKAVNTNRMSEKISPVQKVKRIATQSEPVERFIDSDYEHEESLSVQ